MTDDARLDVNPKWFGNPISQFENGVMLDLRVKLAVDFMKARCFSGSPAEVADLALDTATALLNEAQARGLVKELPDHAELSTPFRNHVKRMATAQALGQIFGDRAMREETSNVTAVGAGAFPMHG